MVAIDSTYQSNPRALNCQYRVRLQGQTLLWQIGSDPQLEVGADASLGSGLGGEHGARLL